MLSQEPHIKADQPPWLQPELQEFILHPNCTSSLFSAIGVQLVSVREFGRLFFWWEPEQLRGEPHGPWPLRFNTNWYPDILASMARSGVRICPGGSFIKAVAIDLSKIQDNSSDVCWFYGCCWCFWFSWFVFWAGTSHQPFQHSIVQNFVFCGETPVKKILLI